MRHLLPAFRLASLPLRTVRLKLLAPRRRVRGCHGNCAEHAAWKQTAWQSSGTGPRRARVTLLAAAHGVAALGTAAFVELSETDNSGTEYTAETRMLAVSRAEMAKTVSADGWGPTRLWRQLVLLVDVYVWEPLCTGLRLVQLSCIFVPVLLTAPCIWIGQRHGGRRDGERTGALLWYRILVKAMELAGPTFIKVGVCVYLWTMSHILTLYLSIARTMGSVENGHFPDGNVRRHVEAALERAGTLDAAVAADGGDGLWWTHGRHL